METLFSFRYMRVLTAILLVMIIAAVGAVALQTFNWTFDDHYATINVDGVAEVTAVPDVATFSFAVEATGEDVGEAQRISGETINDIMAYLKDAGIDEKDIKTTGYNAYPEYDYN